MAALSKACSRKPLGRFDLHVHSVRFLSPPAASYDLLWVTVAPIVTSRHLSTRRVGRVDATMAIDFAESLELLPNSVGARRLGKALTSADEADAMIVYTLWGKATGDSTVPGEALAEGSISLREVWASGADLVRSALPLFMQRTEVAELSITVHALHAIRAATAKPRATAAAAAADVATAQSIASAASVGVGAGMGAGPPLAAPLMRSSAELAMAEVLRTGSVSQGAEAQLVGASSGIADRADRAMLWKASINLGQTAADASGAASARQRAEDASEWGAEMAHNVLVQFVCFSTDDPTPPDSIYLSFQLFHFAPRTTPRALLLAPDDAQAAAARAAAGGALTADGGAGSAGGAGDVARADAIVVVAKELMLREKFRDAPWSALAIELELSGVHPLPPELSEPQQQRGRGGRAAGGGPPPLQDVVMSPSVPKRNRRVDFGFTHAFETPAGSAAATALSKALEPSARAHGDGVVRIYLRAPTGRDGSMVEVAQGEVPLHLILSKHADLVSEPVKLTSRTDDVGTLTVSVFALSAIHRLQAEERGRSATAEEGHAVAGAVARAAGGREEDWMLVAADAALAREGPGLVERFLVSPPGAEEDGGGESSAASATAATAAARSDGEAFAAVQARRFQQYLETKSVCIDVWDGASLLQIGSARVPLSALLKKGSEKVGAATVAKEYLTVDVLDTALTSIDSAPSADAAAVVQPALRGKLKLVLARLSSASPGAKASAAAATARRAAASPESSGAARQKVRLRALTDASAGVTNLPVRAREPTAAEEAALYRKQLRRQKQREWLRLGGGKAGASVTPLHLDAAGGLSRSAEFPSGGGGALGIGGAGAAGTVARSLELGMADEHTLSRARLQLQQRSLKAAEAYRQSHREERLRFLLADQASLTRYVYPSYGGAEIIELPFRNPYSEPHSFTIDWDDALGHVSLVADLGEWRSLKSLHGLPTPAEDGMLLQGRQLWLQPQELVYVPIKYQGWQHGQVAPTHSELDAAGGTAGVQAASAAREQHAAAQAAAAASRRGGASAAALTAAMPLGRRTLTIRVLNVKSETVGALELRVRPQPYVIDQTFRFHQSEHEFLKTTIRMAPVRWHASTALPARPVPEPLRSAAGGADRAACAGAVGASAVSVPPPMTASIAPPVWVRASDPNVQCGVHERKGPADPLEIYIKFKCGASPTVTRFLVQIYHDEWMHECAPPPPRPVATRVATWCGRCRKHPSQHPSQQPRAAVRTPPRAWCGGKVQPRFSLGRGACSRRPPPARLLVRTRRADPRLRVRMCSAPAPRAGSRRLGNSWCTRCRGWTCTRSSVRPASQRPCFEARARQRPRMASYNASPRTRGSSSCSRTRRSRSAAG